MASADPVSLLLQTTGHMDVLQQLSSALPYLSPSEQTVARYIVSHTAEVEHMGSTELAEAAGVSPATIYRLCKQLGLNGYSALRAKVGQARALYADSFIAPVNLAAVGKAGSGPLEAAVYNGVRVLLDALAAGNEVVDQAATALVAAERIIVCGIGPLTAGVATMAGFGFRRLGLTCLPWVNEMANDITQSMLHNTDAVMGFSHTGGNATVTELLKMADAAGAITIAMTNYQFSPVAEAARIKLITSFRETHIQHEAILPRIGHMVIVQALLDAMEAKLNDDATRSP